MTARLPVLCSTLVAVVGVTASVAAAGGGPGVTCKGEPATYVGTNGDDHLTRGDFDLGLPEAFRAQLDAVGSHLRQIGRAYARHPRWGTYLHAEHLAAIGGVDRVRAEVAPARIEPVGALTYLQLTDSIDTALTPEAGAKRRALEALMAPILVGAPLPPPAPTV